MAARLVLSASTLAMLTRMVWSLSSVASRARAMILILLSCNSRSANGGTAQPMSIWPVIVEVSVPGKPPVAVGFAFDPACLSSERRMRFDDEPGAEKAAVLLSASLRLRIGLSDLTYQNSSCAPVICAEITRIGAPLE